MKKDGQTYINIWHGTPLKKLGLAKNANGKHKDGNTQKNFIDADYLLYPNEYTKVHMLESYKVATLMQGKALNLGYPRTGGMLAAQKQICMSFVPSLRRTVTSVCIYAYLERLSGRRTGYR